MILVLLYSRLAYLLVFGHILPLTVLIYIISPLILKPGNLLGSNGLANISRAREFRSGVESGFSLLPPSIPIPKLLPRGPTAYSSDTDSNLEGCGMGNISSLTWMILLIPTLIGMLLGLISEFILILPNVLILAREAFVFLSDLRMNELMKPLRGANMLLRLVKVDLFTRVATSSAC